MEEVRNEVKKEAMPLEVDKVYDTLIIGLGPAGLNAALYLRRKGLDVGIIGRALGGQVADTAVVENYLGYKNITGVGLTEDFFQHVLELEVPVLQYFGATKIEKGEDGNFSVTAEDEKVYKAHSVIFATGASKRKLGVEGEDKFYGRGVTYCAICDGPLYKGAKVLVAGGGNSAVEAALDLSKIATEVQLVHRSQFRADKILLDQMEKVNNIHYRLETQIESINGNMGVDSVTVKNKKTGETEELAVEGVFVEIGNIPNTDLVKGLVELSDKGEVITDAVGATSLAGLYAAGDCTTVPYKQIITAAAQGASAALGLNDWFKTKNFN